MYVMISKNLQVTYISLINNFFKKNHVTEMYITLFVINNISLSVPSLSGVQKRAINNLISALSFFFFFYQNKSDPQTKLSILIFCLDFVLL